MAGLVLGLVRCDWTSDPVDGRSLVVETFLETGRALPAVTLRETQSLRASDSLGDAVTGATVTLVLGDRTVPYTEQTSGRYEPDTALVVPPRTPWRLTVTWDGGSSSSRSSTTAEAEGITPARIEIYEVCVEVSDQPARAVQVDSLRRDSLDIPADQGYLYPIEVTVKWDRDRLSAGDRSAYWVRTQLRPDATPFPSEVVEFFLEPAQIRREDQFSQPGDATQWQGVYAVPVDSSDAPLPPHDLTTALVRGDSAFASFAQTRTDPDRREPISNVDGALGVALSVSVDSITRVIEPELKTCREAVPPGRIDE